MTKAGKQIIEAMQSGVGAVHFMNPFTGKTEPYTDPIQAQTRMLIEAANRIAELQEEVRQIKAHLVL
ncbi:hypothetical protein [Agrobacterium pusense]|uniref:hypothetical protein n=1 Tax=Agrobacterium pusense TaxID=648995 RepID=UPI0010ADDE75|nr:hypothetical protein [Agrobacterium pusense]WCK26634.1 hypothetical protein CFBP5496_0020760 [Agrobacterium pusense]